ncbi:MAG: alkaline phosphatase family protein [Clostridia bacterium]|nr:alkaline phosphatase family protein [Clostridia bacterium]
MGKKVILILVDGMRPDAIPACGSDYAPRLLAESACALDAATVFPSVTLPCHMSLFHSVDPDRHGIVTNTYVPQVRPIEGLVERLDRAEKKCAFFYTWEELRDLTRPDHLACAVTLNLHKARGTDQAITAAAIDYINRESPDFLFLYLGETDEVGGHDAGWMSETYMGCVKNALDCVRRVRQGVPADYDIILLADHGGHDRGHGTDRPEDMTIPIILNGPSFAPGQAVKGASIKDVAPTIAEMLGASPAREWEGRSLLGEAGRPN